MKMVIFSIVFGMFTRGYGQWGISSEAMQLQVASQSHSTASDLQKNQQDPVKRRAPDVPLHWKWMILLPQLMLFIKPMRFPFVKS